MKDIIIISAYCPDDERKLMLEKCINSLQGLKKDFDLLISSHSYVPEHIGKKVDFVFYDGNNDLIYDWDKMNLPWFSPTPDLVIVSSLISNFSTYSACNRIFTGGLGIAKNFGYIKAHYIDYDIIINDYSEFYENSKLLNEYATIQYTDTNNEFYELNKKDDWGYGIFQAFNLNEINKLLVTYNEKELLKILDNSSYKTNEAIFQDIHRLNNKKILYKNLNDILKKGNQFNLSINTQKDDLNDWFVPFYNTKTNKIDVIAWNSKRNYPVNVNFIINQETIISLKDVAPGNWKMQEVNNIENINEILIIVNNKIKNNIIINTSELKEKFKRNNHTRYN
jgi:hypothetical protein